MSARVTGRALLGWPIWGWPIWASVGAHAAALASAATLVTLSPAVVPPEPAPVEVVRVEPAAPPPPERPKPVKRDKPREKIVALRPITQPVEQPQNTAPALLADTTMRESAPASADPPDGSRRFLAGASSSSSWALSGGSGTGSGKLFSTGDLPMPGAPGAGGKGSGGPTQTASIGNSTDLTSFARPLGGYQTKPRYPDAARRQGIEGETLLRFQVLATGRVAAMIVARSAGSSDLDRAAMEAVKTWVFEPARRGEEAVTVWVTLPVRFKLRDGLGDD
jgi:protein TonB